jgi:osmotically-inducible protein OsmY
MLLGTAVVLVAVAAPVVTAEESWLVSDAWVTIKTKMALFADTRVKGRQIEVGTAQGLVTLKGTVDSEEARQVSEDIAKGISGTKDVVNELLVAGLEPGNTAQNDEVITAAIKDHIVTDPDTRVKQAGIEVRTSGGIVSLKGEVPDLSTSDHAAWTAWKTPGVKRVDNEISVKEPT